MPVSVVKRSPPPVAMSQSRKGALRRFNKERAGKGDDDEDEEVEDEEDVEVVEVKRLKEEEDISVRSPQSFCSRSAKEMEPPKEEEDEEEEDDEDENGVMEVDDESGAEDKDKDLLR